jgi:hypothetical protein
LNCPENHFQLFPFVCSSRLDLKSNGFQDTKIPAYIDWNEKAGHRLGAVADTWSHACFSAGEEKHVHSCQRPIQVVLEISSFPSSLFCEILAFIRINISYLLAFGGR